LLWALDFLVPTNEDTMLINGLFYIASAVLVLFLVHKLTANKNLKYLLILFAITLLTLPYSFSKFFSSLLLMAFLLFLIVSLDMVLIRRYHMQYAGIIGSIFAITGIFFSILLLFNVAYTDLWWWILNPILALFIFMVHLDQKYFSLITPEKNTSSDKQDQTCLCQPFVCSVHLIHYGGSNRNLYYDCVAS